MQYSFNYKYILYSCYRGITSKKILDQMHKAIKTVSIGRDNREREK